MSGFLRFWPQEASHYAAQVDGLIVGFTVLMVLLTAPVFVLIVVFAVKYRHGSKADRKVSANRSVWLETSWAVVPFLLTLGFFVVSTRVFFQLGHPPADAMVVNVVAKQWIWKFEHAEGQREIDDLHVPVGRAVKLVMTSQDVIHSLYLPALRIKQDVLPGRYTSLWFKADRPGDYPLRCAEFCGLDHSLMGGTIHIMEPGDYARWLEEAGTDGSLAQQGFALFRSLGCSGCHGDQSSRRAPSLNGVYLRPTPLDDGRVVTADEQYIRDSILTPNRDVAAGYAPIMPSFAGQVSEEELLRLTAYVKSLATAPPQRTGEVAP